MKKTVIFMVIIALVLTLSCCSNVSEAAQKVISDIDSIGVVTLSSGDILTTIEKEYTALSADEKETVTNYTTFETAVEQYHEVNYAEAMNKLKEESYSEAIVLFESLGEYKDATEQIKESKYLQAQDCMNNAQYEECIALLETIPDYKLANEYIDTCRYELSVDGRFMKALAAGLEARWEAAGNVDTDKEHLLNLISLEMTQVDDFRDEKFEDAELGELAVSYIKALDHCLQALEYYDKDYWKYDDLYAQGQDERYLLIRDFYEKYDLKVSAKHSRTLTDFLNNAKAIDEQEAVNKALSEEIANIEVEVKKVYDWYEYTFIFANNTEVTFEDFSFEVQLFAEENLILCTVYTNYVEDFAPGQKAKFKFSSDDKAVSFKFIADYTIEY